MYNKEQLITDYTLLKEIVDGIKSKESDLAKNTELTETGKRDRLERYIDDSGLLPARDKVVQGITDYQTAKESAEVAAIVSNLENEQYQQSIDRMIEAITDGYTDEVATIQLIDTIKRDPVSLAKLKDAAAVKGYMLPPIESPNTPNYEGMARTLKNEITPASVKTNGAVISLLLDEHARMVGAWE